MIKELLELTKLGYGIPEDEELEQCIKIQKENPDKLVKLHYTVKWSGQYCIYFMNDDGTISETIEEVKEGMPKYYAL